MSSLKFPHIPAVILVVAATAACAPTETPVDNTGAPLPIETYKESYLLAPLDTITVTHDNKHVDTLKVTLEDKLEYPSGERFHAIGRTPDQVTELLKDRDSSITSVTVTEFKGNRISVTGEVNIQTNFDLQDAPMRVLDAIASAGGFTPLANTSSVRLIRHTSGEVEVFQLNMHDVERGKNVYLDMLLQPGDHIFVPNSFL
jgi:polysaccharide export outer membrane protein